jgi:hypothetical protein
LSLAIYLAADVGVNRWVRMSSLPGTRPGKGGRVDERQKVRRYDIEAVTIQER